jgi:hypothetical protein
MAPDLPNVRLEHEPTIPFVSKRDLELVTQEGAGGFWLGGVEEGVNTCDQCGVSFRRLGIIALAMPDMLVRLYDLPASDRYDQRVAAAGLKVRRAEPWDKPRLKAFVQQHFNDLWAVEAERAFSNTPVTAYVAVKDRDIVGFAVYECTRRNYFGPTGVRDDVRKTGVGAALLFRCLESMREIGYAYAIIGGVGPASFYEKTCGAFLIPGSETGVYAPLSELFERPNR